jgi:small-conductance mechanosensitive channel
MPSSLLRALLIALFAACMAIPGSAQILPQLGSGSDQTQGQDSDLADAIRQAASSGVNVIVIDSAGRVVTTTTPQTDTPPEPKPSENMAGASSLMKAQSQVQEFRNSLQDRLAVLPTSINEVAFILRATSPDGKIMAYAELAFWTLVLFALARLVTGEIYGKRFARRFVVSRIQDDPKGYHDKMPFLVFRFVMGIGGTLFAMALAYVAGYLIFGFSDDLSMQFTVTALYATFFITRTISDLWRMILSPYLSQYRLPHFSDRDARRLYHWAWILATYNVAAIMLSTWISDFGLNYNVYALLYGFLSLIGALGNIAMVLFNGNAISNAIRGGKRSAEVPWITRFLSVAWAPALVVYVVFGWFKLAFDLVLDRPESIPMIAGAYVVFLSIIIVYGGINYVIERYFDRSRAVERLNTELEQAEAEENSAAGGVDRIEFPARHQIMTFEALARRVAGILAFGAGAYALLRIWAPEGMISDESLAGRSKDVIAILFIGYILYNFFRIWIDSKIAEETVDDAEAELGDEGGVASSSRLATLLPLFRGAILAVVVVTVLLMALLELGINVSPLFAGAGVIGLAVGFGAQTLVRDIFSGAFFLIDDAFRKGEYIDIGDVKGTVEKISVRSFQLRHHLGALNTIPFGEIKVLTNYSRDWVIMKLPLRVTYDTDVEKVRKLIKNLGVQLLDDPIIGENFIQPLKSQGVIEMQDSAMIIRVKFMTKPGDQWLVRKRVYEDIRDLFAREGIRFAHREVTVRLADGKAEDLTPAQKEAVTGAVSGAIDEDFLDDIGPGGDDR